MNNKMSLKRVLSVFMAICLTLGTVWTGNMAEVKANTPVVNFDETNIAMSFAVLSDLHLHQSSNAVTANVQRQVYRYANTVAALNQLSKNNGGGGLDLLMLAGDYCDIGTNMQATTFAKATQGILTELSSVNNKTTQFIMAYGNHETEAGFNTANPHMTYEEWETVLRDHGLAATAENAPWGCNHITVTKGEKTYHFFSLEIYAYATNLILNKALTWLDTELANVTTADPNAYVYLACHGPAMESGVYGADATFDVNASWGTSQSGKTGTTYANDADYPTQEATSGNLDDVLKKYPQVVHFSGHYHYTNILESTIMQKNYTAVAVSALSDSSPAALWNQGYYDSLELNSMLESYLYNGYSLLVEVDKDGNQRITRVKMDERFSNNSLYAMVTYQSDKSETTDNLNADGTVFEYMDESKYVASVAFLDTLSSATFETLTPWVMNAPESDKSHLLTYSQNERKATPVFQQDATLDISDVTLGTNNDVSFNVTFDTVGAKTADTNYVIRYELEIYNQDGNLIESGNKTDNIWFVGNFVSSTKGVVSGSGTSHLDATKLSYDIRLTSSQLSGATGIYAKLYAVDEFGGKSEALTFGSQTDVISVVEPEDSDGVKMEVNSTTWNNTFYILYLKPEDVTEIEDIGFKEEEYGTYTKIYIDEKETTSAALWLKPATVNDCQSLQLAILPGKIETGKTPTQIGTHLIQIPSGTVVGNIKFADDVYVHIEASTMRELHPTSLKADELNASDASRWYAWYFKPTDGKAVGDGTTKPYSKVLYVDGQKVENGINVIGGNSSLGRFTFLINYEQIKSGVTTVANIGTHTVTIPKHTYFEDRILIEDVILGVQNNIVHQLEPTTIEKNRFSYNDADGAAWYAWYFKPADGRQIVDVGAYSKTLYVDGVKVENAIAGISGATGGSEYGFLIKYDKIEPEATTVSDVGLHVVTIPKGSYFGDVLLSEDIHLSVNKNAVDIAEPSYKNVSTEYDRESGARNANIYINTSSDLLSSGVYSQSKFTKGGITVNGEYLDGITIQKVYDGRYCINLENVASSLKTGCIVTLEGTLTHVITNVTFEKISFIRNADGSFSSYDESKEAVADRNVALNEVWVNIDKFGSYDIESAPLLEGGKAECLVNSATPSNTTLTEVGDYNITRVLGNAILADTVGNELGDITYTQTAHLFKTGDANGDGKLSVVDIVRQIKEEGKTDNLVKGKTDLNYDDKMNGEDRRLLVNLMLENITAEDIYSEEDSVVIGAISDTHYMADGSDGQNRINTRKALNYYKSQNAEVIIINGDVTDSGEPAAYTKLEEDIVAVYPNEGTRPTFVITEDTRSATNTYYEVNGYHFIGVSSDEMKGEQYTYDSETIAFVREKLEAANNADSNKPIFLAVHQAPPNTVYGSDGLDCFSSAEMDELLKLYPNLVIVSSYTHAPLQNDKSIVQDDFTTLNTASLYCVGGLSNMENIAPEQMSDIYQFGQGLLIRASGNDVAVERCDFYNDEKVKDNWTFTAGDNTKYTVGYTNEKPKFADDEELDVEWVDDVSVNITFNAVSNKDSVEYYEVSAYNISSDTVDATKKFSSFYWKDASEMPESFEVILDGLTNKKSYRFEVKAFDYWGRSVNLTFKYEAPKPENVKVTISGIYGTSLGVSTGGTHNGFYLITDQNMTGGLWKFYEDTNKQIHHYVFGEGTTYGRKSDICWSGGEYLYVQTYDVYKDGDVIYIPQGLTFTIDDITYEIKNSYKLTCSGGGTSLIAAEGQDIVKVNITGCAEQYSTTATEFYLTTDLNPGLASAEQWKTFCDSGDQFGTPGVATYIRWGAATWLNICRKDHASITDGTVMTILKGARFTANGITYEIAKTTTITRESGSWTVEVLP